MTERGLFYAGVGERGAAGTLRLGRTRVAGTPPQPLPTSPRHPRLEPWPDAQGASGPEPGVQPCQAHSTVLTPALCSGSLPRRTSPRSPARPHPHLYPPSSSPRSRSPSLGPGRWSRLDPARNRRLRRPQYSPRVRPWQMLAPKRQVSSPSRYARSSSLPAAPLRKLASPSLLSLLCHTQGLLVTFREQKLAYSERRGRGERRGGGRGGGRGRLKSRGMDGGWRGGGESEVVKA